MSNKLLFFALLFSISFVFTACDPDDPEPPIEPEVITTLIYTLTPMGGGTPVVLSFQDVDGDGGNDPIISTDPLSADETYTGALTLFNESGSMTEDITMEIEEEDDEHQLFYQPSFNTMTVTYTDEDGNGNPVGLSTTLTTGEVAEGSIKITLRHQPDKTAPEVASGNITNAGGETDIEVTFPIRVQ